ncbi:hypothetical protein [Lactococcus lactis]|uniref:hypothetical protein n=1 Tax=Lactococcus lactis TaxID=1358 RepID=UPI0018C54135|nr:hypothetical protein [Lactococcus lactis]MBG1279315.1 hypothetical protein [Lactococcus lactis subsp. lactis]
MEIDKKIEDLRNKQRGIAIKQAKKQEELEVLSQQYDKLSKQIENLGDRELKTALREQKITAFDAANLFKEIKKLDLSPLEALDLFKSLNQENETVEASVSTENLEGEHYVGD